MYIFLVTQTHDTNLLTDCSVYTITDSKTHPKLNLQRKHCTL